MKNGINQNWSVKKDLSETKDTSGDIVKEILVSRGFKTAKDQKSFLNPKNPESIALKEVGIKTSQVKTALTRLKKALKSGEKIIVFGDYDADGICSTAIIWEALDHLGFDAMPHIPKREEGYGIKRESLDRVLRKYPKTKILITVDNGIVAHDAVSYASKNGIDTIILDHHEVSEKYPSAYAIIHTKILCGAGISYFFVRELRKNIKNRTSHFSYHDPIDLAAIGTVADQMKLIGVNRSIVKYGISKLRSTRRIGLIQLLKEAGVERKDLETYQINYVIAPRINAMGRIDEAMQSVRLLCVRSLQNAEPLAGILGETNRKRQLMVEKSIKYAFQKLKNYDFSVNSIVVGDNSFHEGVIGLIASKLTEKYHMPSIVLSVGKDISKASARSIKGFNVNASIRKLSNLTLGGGGHEMAAGFSIQSKKVEKFKKSFCRLSKESITEKMLRKTLNIDAKVVFSQLSMKLAKELLMFEPFGLGNPTPVFCVEDISVENYRKVGSDEKHMKLTLSQSEKKFDAIFFNYGSDAFLKSDTIKIAFQLGINSWNGRENLQFVVKDIKTGKDEK